MRSTVVSIIEPFALIEFPYAKLQSIKGTKKEAINAAIAFEKLNRVYASQCFEQNVILRDFSETNGLNNQEIYNQFRQGIININLIFYTGSWVENHILGIIGYIRDGIPDTVFQNRYFVETPDEIARNMIHEIAHIVGFMHYEVFSTSVPYQMNEIWDECKDTAF